jgi:hypothetical protein
MLPDFNTGTTACGQFGDGPMAALAWVVHGRGLCVVRERPRLDTGHCARIVDLSRPKALLAKDLAPHSLSGPGLA